MRDIKIVYKLISELECSHFNHYPHVVDPAGNVWLTSKCYLTTKFFNYAALDDWPGCVASKEESEIYYKAIRKEKLINKIEKHC